MSDLIDRQDALRALSKEVCGDKIWALDARDAIVHLPSAEQKMGKWIPCSEGYPEMDERVLVNLDGRYDIHVWDCMSNRSDSYFWEDEFGLYHNKYEVLYWMRIPELSVGE